MTTKENTINEQFKEQFKEFEYPFLTSDQKLGKMHEVRRNTYYRKANALKRNPVLHQEITELTRYFYAQLANCEEKENRMLYKGALMFLNKFWDRISGLAMLSEDFREKDLGKDIEDLID